MSGHDDIAIKVENVSKTFRLPHEKNDSLKSAVVNFYRRKRTFEKQQVLDDISFEIKKGEFFGIVGRNGSGKSTLLKLLAGIYSPSSGAIHTNGKLTPFIELGVGFNMELTGRENVFLNGALLGFNRKEMNAMYKDIVDFAELERFMDQKLKNYSSGMQVRLAFSIAIRAKTDILLIDEVLAVGDQNFQEKCFDYFAKIRNSGKTIILVTHDMASVSRFCNRVLLLDSRLPAQTYEVGDAIAKYNDLNREAKAPDEPKSPTRKKQGIYIKDVKLVGGGGTYSDSFMQGEKFALKVDIGSEKKIDKEERISVGLGFYDKEHINMSGPNSYQEQARVKDGTFEYTIPKLPFNTGEYKITIGLFNHDGTKQYDFIDKGISFFVNTKKPRFGKILLEDKWSIGKEK
jgi:ABC-2 type transport system ATP-binding protein